MVQKHPEAALNPDVLKVRRLPSFLLSMAVCNKMWLVTKHECVWNVGEGRISTVPERVCRSRVRVFRYTLHLNKLNYSRMSSQEVLFMKLFINPSF